MVIFTFSASKLHSFCLRFMIQCELTPDSVFWSSMVISSCLQILVSGDTVSLPSWELTYPHIPSKGSWEDEFPASHLVGYVIVPWRVCMFSLEPQTNLSCLIACIIFAWVMVFHHIWQVSHSFSKRPVLQTGWLWWTHQSGYRMWEKMGWGFIHSFCLEKEWERYETLSYFVMFLSTFIVYFWFSKFRRQIWTLCCNIYYLFGWDDYRLGSHELGP